jgi:hypothetical protein
MNPSRHIISDTTTGTNGHAHLLVAEPGGLMTPESPEAVMAEVAYRKTCISSLLEKMFREEEAQNQVDDDEPE